MAKAHFTEAEFAALMGQSGRDPITGKARESVSAAEYAAMTRHSFRGAGGKFAKQPPPLPEEPPPLPEADPFLSDWMQQEGAEPPPLPPAQPPPLPPAQPPESTGAESAASGAAAGAQRGAGFGPVGMAAGAVLGGAAGFLMAESQKPQLVGSFEGGTTSQPDQSVHYLKELLGVQKNIFRMGAPIKDAITTKATGSRM